MRIVWGLALALATGVDGQVPTAWARSSRIEALRAALASNDSTAEPRFWKELRERGTPMIEPAAHADSAIVTFVLQAPAATRSVTLVSSANVLLGAPNAVVTEQSFDTLGRMTRLPGSSSVWYVSMIAPRDVRVPYRFRVDTVRATPIAGAGMMGVSSDGQTFDPLNPKRWSEQDAALRASVLELPNAPAQPWRSITQSRGTWKRHSLKSRSTGSDRPIWVYLPPGFNDSRGAPLLIGLSSGSFASAIPVDAIVDQLSTRPIRRLPVTVVVDELPSDDTTAYRGTTSFLADELVPWMRTTYGVSRRPSDVILTGASRRGVIATIAATTRPDVFGSVLSMSGGFSWRPPGGAEWEWTTQRVAASPRQAVRFYLAAGRLETVVNTRNQGHYLLATNRHLRDVLRARGYDVTYREFSGVHSELNWQDQLYDGLIALLGAKGAPR